MITGHRLCVLFVASATLGCSSPSTSAPGPIEMVLTTTVPAGGEVFRCQYLTLPEGTHDIIRFEHEYTIGSHHILLYPTSLTPAQAAARPGDFDCTTVGDLGQTGLAYGASEEAVGFQDYPEGVGLRLASEQVVLLEAHYLNASDADLDATVVVRMFESETPIDVEAGNLFFYNYAILIPPAPGAATSAMSCELPAAINLQFAASHMHRRGTYYTSSLIAPTGDITPLHETTDWESAEPDLFDPALPIEAGSRIEFACDFENDLPSVVVEGESADTNEMCMFIASYWPRQSEAVESCVGGSSGPILNGDASCLETLGCLEGAATDVAVQECIADSCQAASAPLGAFVFCVEAANCNSDACIEANCLSEYLACDASAC